MLIGKLYLCCIFSTFLFFAILKVTKSNGNRKMELHKKRSFHYNRMFDVSRSRFIQCKQIYFKFQKEEIINS